MPVLAPGRRYEAFLRLPTFSLHFHPCFTHILRPDHGRVMKHATDGKDE